MSGTSPNLYHRRSFLTQSGIAVGASALGTLLAQEMRASTAVSAPGWQHFPPRVKRVIFLCMAGGPSQFETFYNKPEMAQWAGKEIPKEILGAVVVPVVG